MDGSMASPELMSKVDLADAIKAELECDDFRPYIFKQKIDGKAFIKMQTQRLEKFCLLDDQGGVVESISEGDLAKLEDLQSKYRANIQNILPPNSNQKSNSMPPPSHPNSKHNQMSSEMDKQVPGEAPSTSHLMYSAPSPGEAERSATTTSTTSESSKLKKREVPKTLDALTPSILYHKLQKCSDLLGLIGTGGCEELRRLFDLLEANLDSELGVLSEEELRKIDFQSDPRGLAIREAVCSKTMDQTKKGRIKIQGRYFEWPMHKMKGTLSNLLADRKRPARKKEERRMRGIIDYSERREAKRHKALPPSRTAESGQRVWLWGIDNTGKKKQPVKLGAGTILDVPQDDKFLIELDLTMDAVVQESEFITLIDGRELTELDFQKGSTIDWPSHKSAWSHYFGDIAKQKLKDKKAAVEQNASDVSSPCGPGSNVSNFSESPGGRSPLKSALEQDENEVTSPLRRLKKAKRKGSNIVFEMEAEEEEMEAEAEEMEVEEPGAEEYFKGDTDADEIRQPANKQTTPQTTPQTTTQTRTQETPKHNQGANYDQAANESQVPSRVQSSIGASTEPSYKPEKNLPIYLLAKNAQGMQKIASGIIKKWDDEYLTVQIKETRRGPTGDVPDADEEGQRKPFSSLEPGDRILWFLDPKRWMPKEVPYSTAKKNGQANKNGQDHSDMVEEGVHQAQGMDLTAEEQREEEASQPLQTGRKRLVKVKEVSQQEQNGSANRVNAPDSEQQTVPSAPVTEQRKTDTLPPKDDPPLKNIMPPPTRDLPRRSTSAAPGTWRTDMHKASCIDPRTCPGCSRLALDLRNGTQTQDTSLEPEDTSQSLQDDRPSTEPTEAEVFNKTMICLVMSNATSADQLNRTSLINKLLETKSFPRAKVMAADFRELIVMLAEHYIKNGLVRIEGDWKSKKLPRKAIQRNDGWRNARVEAASASVELEE